MAYQTLYRRYRPRRFSDVRGQPAVIRALRNSVRDDRVGHAYLFSGPRGTGKTSTARILAKALNCEHLDAGEPDGTCESCLAIDAGTSYDVQELDAASNNKVEDIRDLIGRVALGSPGRTKVYILDEVHMLTPSASASLLKTLEEPPPHVVFVLATTDPQKVLDTIRSRTQHFEFHLLSAEELAEHVAWVIHDAGLDLPDSVIEHVVRQGRGSARDTLSALDQVAAAGGVMEQGDALGDLLDAIAASDAGKALVAVSDAVSSGRDPRVLGEALLARLRDIFLVRMGASVEHLSAADVDRVRAWAARLGDRATTRALEAVGDALLEMRQAPDPRIPLEVAMVKLARVDLDPSLDALTVRVARLEAALASMADDPRPSALGESAESAESADPQATPASGAPAVAAPMGAADAGPTPPDPSSSSATAVDGGSGATSDHPRPTAPESLTDADGGAGGRAGEATEAPSAPPPPPGGARPADIARAQLASHRRARAEGGTGGGRPAAPATPGRSSGPPPTPPSVSSSAQSPDAVPEAAPRPPAAPPVSQSSSAASQNATPQPPARMPDSPSRSADSPSASSQPVLTSEGRPSSAPASSSEASSGSPVPSSEAGGDSSGARADEAPAAVAPSAPAEGSGDGERLGTLWEQSVLPALGGLAKAMFSPGRVLEVDGSTVVFALPNEVHRQKCERKRPEVERAWTASAGAPVTLRLAVDAESTGPPEDGASIGNPSRTEPPSDDDDELVGADVHALEDATDVPKAGIELLLETFGGAQLVDET